MNWLTWVMAIGLVLCVAGVAVYQSRKTGLETYELVLLISTTLYVSGCCLGFFVTEFSSPTLDSWRQALWIRTVWTLGGAVLMPVAVFWSAVAGDTVGKPAVWLLAAGFLAIGVLCCLNPLRDLINGPAALRLVSIRVQRDHGGARGGASISSQLQLLAPDGQRREMELLGWAASDANDRLAQCPDRAKLMLLLHVERVIGVTCD